MLSNVIASQGLLHERYGGVVPELAAAPPPGAHRRRDRRCPGARRGAPADLEGVAVTHGPGLIGALLVGLSLGQGAGRRAPASAHPRGPPARTRGGAHAPPGPDRAPVPVPGGQRRAHVHRRVDEPSAYRILGQTLDDAAGEAFDKGARLLGLGYPGGPEVDRLAREGDPEAFDFPRCAPGELDFSFSGLKTSLFYRSATWARRPARRADLAASYQRAIVDALVARVAQALERERLEPAYHRRRGGRELGAAASAGGLGVPVGSRRWSCAPTTRR